jgi:hypothetical protein
LPNESQEYDVSVAGCLGYDVLASITLYNMKDGEFQLLVD